MPTFKPFSLADTYEAAESIKGMKANNVLNQMNIEAAQGQKKKQNSLTTAARNSGGDMNNFLTSPEAFEAAPFEVMEMRDNQKKNNATDSKVALETETAELELALQQYTALSTFLGSSIDQPSYTANRQLAIQLLKDPSLEATIPTEYNPDVVKQWMESTMTAKEKISTKLEDDKFQETKRHNEEVEKSAKTRAENTGGGLTSNQKDAKALVDGGVFKTEAEALSALTNVTRVADVIRVMEKMSDDQKARYVQPTDPEYKTPAQLFEEAKKLVSSNATVAGSGNDFTKSTVHKPTTQADFDKIPSGEIYLNPADGKEYTKK